MRVLAITQRVDTVDAYAEKRDALDQKWCDFLTAAGFLPLILPNRMDAAVELLHEFRVSGLVLSGGNDIEKLGGNALERDELELALLDRFITKGVPVLGVCRGMQVIQTAFGVELAAVPGHVAVEHSVQIGETQRSVNSYHKFGAYASPEELPVSAIAQDGVIEAVRHRNLPIVGMMWHPERMSPFDGADLDFFRKHFQFPDEDNPAGTSGGRVYWLTGLSGSGKTTIGALLTSALRNKGRAVVQLDGDDIRNALGNDLGHTRKDRFESAMRNARMCRMLSMQGLDVVCCTISMFDDVRGWNRENIQNYCEIYLKVPMDILKSRDPKGIYMRAESGELKNVYGVDLPWDEPTDPHFVVVNDGAQSPEKIVSDMLSQFQGAAS